MLWQLVIVRYRQDHNDNVDRTRTVGSYWLMHDGKSTGLGGTVAEPEGPGDNSHTGNHLRVEPGTYRLMVHDGERYKTRGYAFGKEHPRPAIELADTGARKAILIHPGSGFLSSIGCINLCEPLPDSFSMINYDDSRVRVVSLIKDLDRHLGLPQSGIIPNASVVIKGEP